MPNEVLERMAKKLKEYREGLAGTVFSHKEYPSADDTVFELLGIVEEQTELIDDACFDGPASEQKSVWMTDELFDAFQLAREAREEREKNGG